MLSYRTGALVGDRVRCPFHGACFNTKTGDIEEFPGLDSLPKYKVLQGSLLTLKVSGSFFRELYIYNCNSCGI